MAQAGYFTITDAALRDLGRQLDDFSQAATRNMITRASKIAMNDMWVAARQEAPVGNSPYKKGGSLRDSLKIQQRRSVRFGTRTVVTSSKEEFPETFYGAFVEFGHHQGARPKGLSHKKRLDIGYLNKVGKGTRPTIKARYSSKLLKALFGAKRYQRNGALINSNRKTNFNRLLIASADNRKWIPPNPFMERAVQKAQHKVINSFKSTLAGMLKRYRPSVKKAAA